MNINKLNRILHFLGAQALRQLDEQEAEPDKELRERVEKILNEHGVFDVSDEIISVVLKSTSKGV